MSSGLDSQIDLSQHRVRGKGITNVKIRYSRPLSVALIVIVLYGLVAFRAESAQLMSAPQSQQAQLGHGNGDSGPCVISGDGRFILFSSAANNLTTLQTNIPVPLLLPPKLNVYLRDRSNNITTLVSGNAAGTGGGNGDSLAMGISAGGRYALFESSASDLVPNATSNGSDVFLRDLVGGTTTLVSVSTNGGLGNGGSYSPVMTPDGRYVAFVSEASNLVPGDTNGIPDIFVRDTQAGTTTLASPGARSTGSAADSKSAAPGITPDGRYVVFYSSATNVVAGVTTVGDIYVRDLVLGSTVWVSGGARSALMAAFGTTNGVCFSPKISADGTAVAYEVSQSGYAKSAGVVLRYDLTSGLTDEVNTNAYAPVGDYEDMRTVDISDNGRFVATIGNTDSLGINTAIYLWDGMTETNILVSTSTNGVPAGGTAYAPLVDPSGRYVAFLSDSLSLTTNMLAAPWNLYCRDMQAGSIILVDADTNGVGTGVNSTTYPSWSTNAEFLAFESADTSDRNQYFSIEVCDLFSNETEIVSAPDPVFSFVSADGPSVLFPNSLSSTARYVAYANDADNLVTNGSGGYRNVYVSDRLMGSNVLVSIGTNGLPANGNSSEPSLSGDGRYVAFSSKASNLVPGDTNGAEDVFVRDLAAGVTTLASVNTSGTGPGNADSYTPTISVDGRFVLFHSLATNLALRPYGSVAATLFLRDLQAGTIHPFIIAPPAGSVSSAAMTPDGHYIAFYGELTNWPAMGLYVWDSVQAKVIYTNAASAVTQVSISDDGTKLAYVTGTGLSIADQLAPANNAVVVKGPFTSRAGLNFSGDGRYLVLSTGGAWAGGDTNGIADVYLYDVLAKTNLLVSHTLGGSGSGNGVSDSPVISPDGRFLVYRSFASNLAPGDSNGVPNLFLYDQSDGTTTLLTASSYGPRSGANRSLNPFFSSDGQTLAFESAAFDVTTNDFNQSGDIFAYNFFTAGLIPYFTVNAIPGPSAAPSPTLVWPTSPGKTYQVWFKNNLTDPNWQLLSGSITIQGSSAYFTDPAPSITQRFYKIVGL